MAIHVPTLNQSIPIVDREGRLTNEGLNRINGVLKASTALAEQALAATAELAAQLALINTAQGDAADALGLAGSAVQQDVGPAWAAPTGAVSRASLAAFVSVAVSNPPTQAEVQAIADALQANSRATSGIITDLQSNGTLT